MTKKKKRELIPEFVEAFLKHRELIKLISYPKRIVLLYRENDREYSTYWDKALDESWSAGAVNDVTIDKISKE